MSECNGCTCHDCDIQDSCEECLKCFADSGLGAKSECILKNLCKGEYELPEVTI